MIINVNDDFIMGVGATMLFSFCILLYNDIYLYHYYERQNEFIREMKQQPHVLEIKITQIDDNEKLKNNRKDNEEEEKEEDDEEEEDEEEEDEEEEDNDKDNDNDEEEEDDIIVVEEADEDDDDEKIVFGRMI